MKNKSRIFKLCSERRRRVRSSGVFEKSDIDKLNFFFFLSK